MGPGIKVMYRRCRRLSPSPKLLFPYCQGRGLGGEEAGAPGRCRRESEQGEEADREDKRREGSEGMKRK